MSYSTHSFEGQDRILHSIFRGVTNGFYVDVGCNHPVNENNTFSLYCSGWSGICIDMNGAFQSDYNHIRPRDQFIESAISATDQPLTAFINSDARLSTCLPEVADHYSSHPIHRHQSVKKVSLTSNTLAQVCNGRLPETWHILAVDVEGYELEVLSSLPLCDVLPVCVVVEIKNLSLLRGFHNYPVASFLLGLGYFPIAKTPLDTFFVNTALIPDWISPSLIHGT